jgi:hypothetical protein
MPADSIVTEHHLPPWALKVVTATAAVLLSAFVAWMVNVSAKLNSMESQHVELRANLSALEHRLQSQLTTENKRYDEMKADLRVFMDRVDLKIDKLLAQRIGASGQTNGGN